MITGAEVVIAATVLVAFALPMFFVVDEVMGHPDSVARTIVAALLWPLWFPGAFLTWIGRKLVAGWAWSVAVAVRDGLWDALRLMAGRGGRLREPTTNEDVGSYPYPLPCGWCGEVLAGPNDEHPRHECGR